MTTTAKARRGKSNCDRRSRRGYFLETLESRLLLAGVTIGSDNRRLTGTCGDQRASA